MKQITRTFFTGLAVTLPVVATLYLLYWAVIASERALDDLLRFLLPREAYFPGQGLALGVVLVFLVGLLMRSWVAQKLFSGIEKMMYRMPLVKTVYGALGDFTDFLSRPKQEATQGGMARLGAAGGHVVRGGHALYPDRGPQCSCCQERVIPGVPYGRQKHP